MDRRLLALILILAGCTPRQQEQAAEPVATVEAATTAVTLPLTKAAESVAMVVAEVLPPQPAPVMTVDPAAVALIVRWEVSGQAAYTRKYQGVICPGGASGPTWGIGYDGGHQTVSKIVADWGYREDKYLLATASGQTGEAKCRAQQAKLRDIRVPYPEAYAVFEERTLPEYQTGTRRALKGVDAMPAKTEGALVSVGYNRGWSMLGSRALEKRAIRDECVPKGDVACVAAQIRAMKRLWPTVKGLRDRRESEAVLAES